jgi:hypothetical protein
MKLKQSNFERNAKHIFIGFEHFSSYYVKNVALITNSSNQNYSPSFELESKWVEREVDGDAKNFF